MVDVDVDTGLSRPFEGSQTLQWLPVCEADDLIIAFQDQPFMGFAQPGDTRGHLAHGRDLDFPTDRRVLDIRAVDRDTGVRILWGCRTHHADARLHASILPVAWVTASRTACGHQSCSAVTDLLQGTTAHDPA